jgi:hypothetical protein
VSSYLVSLLSERSLPSRESSAKGRSASPRVPAPVSIIQDYSVGEATPVASAPAHDMQGVEDVEPLDFETTIGLYPMTSGPGPGSIFGSARNVLNPPSDNTLNPNLLNIYNISSSNHGNPPQDTAGIELGAYQSASQPTLDTLSTSTTSNFDPSLLLHTGNHLPEQVLSAWNYQAPSLSPTSASKPPDSIEAIMPWDDVSFFVSLYIRYQHVLVPLVHKPTFAQEVLARRDREDSLFRCLLISIGE